MNIEYHAHLTWRDPERNLARWCALSVQRGLFGQWSCIRAWGRIGAHGGREYATWHERVEDAHRAFLNTLSQKKRKGYA
jgi:predicted DNA-binding WGR domain protein